MVLFVFILSVSVAFFCCCCFRIVAVFLNVCGIDKSKPSQGGRANRSYMDPFLLLVLVSAVAVVAEVFVGVVSVSVDTDDATCCCCC